MTGCLAIVAYRAVVGDVPTGSLDFQVRWFSISEPDDVRRLIGTEASEEYFNDQQQLVRWELSDIMEVERFDSDCLRDSGEELIGFIAKTDELISLA